MEREARKCGTQKHRSLLHDPRIWVPHFRPSACMRDDTEWVIYGAIIES